MGASVTREAYKLIWPLTQEEFNTLLDSVVFNDEAGTNSSVKVDIFSAGASLTHTRIDLEGKTIIGVKVGQAFLAATDYTLVDDQFTLTDNFDSGTPIIVFYK